MGDGILALFSDPNDAADAAIEMLEAVKRLNASGCGGWGWGRAEHTCAKCHGMVGMKLLKEVEIAHGIVPHFPSNMDTQMNWLLVATQIDT